MSVTRRERREQSRELAREARHSDRIRWFRDAALELLSAVLPQRKAAGALQFLESVTGYMFGGNDVTFASHRTLGANKLRSQRWSMRQARLLGQKQGGLGILVVRHHYRRDKRRTASHVCARHHLDPSSLRTNDYLLDHQALSRALAQLERSVEAPEPIDELAAAPPPAPEPEPEPAPIVDEDANRRANVARVHELLREHLPPIATYEAAAALYKLGREAQRNVGEIGQCLADVATFERPGSPTSKDELWTRAVRFVKAPKLDRATASVGAAQLRIRREDIAPLPSPTSSSTLAQGFAAMVDACKRGPPD